MRLLSRGGEQRAAPGEQGVLWAAAAPGVGWAAAGLGGREGNVEPALVPGCFRASSPLPSLPAGVNGRVTRFPT